MKKSPSKVKKVIAYADIGSHGGIFEFMGGHIANSYPHLMHIFSEKITSDLKKVVITYRT